MCVCVFATGVDTLSVWRIWVISINLILIVVDGERGLGNDHSIVIYNQGESSFWISVLINKETKKTVFI